MLAHRITDPSAPGYGFVPGGPDVSWISAEHNFEARALYARAAALIDGAVGACPAMSPGRPAEAAQLAADLHAATALADAAIGRELFVREGPRRAHLNQGVGDGARPIDAQALGVLWLIGQGRTNDATSVITAADSEMLVTRRWFDGHPEAGRFTGYRPYAEAWGPDVLWMEGTLQMRMAKAAAGVSTARDRRERRAVGPARPGGCCRRPSARWSATRPATTTRGPRHTQHIGNGYDGTDGLEGASAGSGIQRRNCSNSREKPSC